MTVRLFGATGLSPSRRQALSRSVLAALGPEARSTGELCLILVDDAKIKTINRKFLRHNYATDVISFRYPRERLLSKDKEPAFGDIYVATGVAKRQAQEQGHSLFTELMTLSVHGALHLVGYGDDTVSSRSKMFARQDRLVRRFLPNNENKARPQ